MTMPEIDGIDLVGRAESHGIKGLLITAADPRRLKAAAAALQSAPVMRKPFEVDELIRVVARYRPSDGADDVAPVSCSA